MLVYSPTIAGVGCQLKIRRKRNYNLLSKIYSLFPTKCTIVGGSIVEINLFLFSFVFIFLKH